MTEENLGEVVRAVHRRYPTGVSVVTAASPEGKPYGLAVNSFSSVSLDPPLILFAVNVTSSSYPWLFSADHVAVNLLSTSQTAVVRRFAQSGGDKFADIEWTTGQTGSPLIAGCTGRFELAVRYKIPAYTHTVFIGEVVCAEYTDDPALIYLGGKFFDSSDLRSTDA
ncbi:flavin reductase family protein [Modestobacter sp. VKM Ac-2978]|uniref:flavin reductase family protein n=1 Tax=Modestobacter sp. VKM Ac-2978 TaxID=3004132 RepID=UPI0022AA3F4F|nr:flavin reductase family protein [Modestobacter sp. VKM Ac-2978]MCZ2849905.1 flavin reductase family protein [Modestobacter sp. VKM Ac-2978]